MTETTTLIPRRYQLAAEQVAQKLPVLFSNRNLKPAFSDYYLTTYLNTPLLIAVLDTNQIGDHSRYVQPELLHQLSTDLGGMKIYLSNSTGIRLVFLLSPPPKLPHSVELPSEIPLGKVALGVRLDGSPVQVSWSSLGHLLVVGMTGSGKSSLLRGIAIQAIRNDILLGLADIDQTTFAMLEHNPNLFMPIATTPQAALEMIERALSECDTRAALFKSMQGYPENIDEYNAAAIKMGKEPLRRILIILDESSAVFKAMGGGSGELAARLAELGWRGRKFGIHFIFGAQEFTKELTGAVREQVSMSIAFRVRPTAAQMAKSIGCEGAHRIPAHRPGMAIVDRFGPIQAYFVPKPMLLNTGASLIEPLSEKEKALFTRALQETEGKLTLAIISEWGGVSIKQARHLQAQWAVRGWIAKDPNRDNAFCVTVKTQEITANRQTGQTGQTQTNP
ncbi:hypothetical protein MASR2M66_29370 [Chloroflexota bacterium]